jgi:probable rRNA maturation factor
MPVLVSRASIPPSPIASAALRRRGEHMLRVLSLAKSELSILLCDDTTIHALNRQHRRKNKPTDVLAFALREGKPLLGGANMLGDVVISLDTARRQAAEHDRSLMDEVTMLLAHGLLHLIGYDHATLKEERLMNARADVLIAAAKARSAGSRSVQSKVKGPNVTPRRVDKGLRGIAGRPMKRPGKGGVR